MAYCIEPLIWTLSNSTKIKKVSLIEDVLLGCNGVDFIDAAGKVASKKLASSIFSVTSDRIGLSHASIENEVESFKLTIQDEPLFILEDLFSDFSVKEQQVKFLLLLNSSMIIGRLSVAYQGTTILVTGNLQRVQRPDRNLVDAVIFVPDDVQVPSAKVMMRAMGYMLRGAASLTYNGVWI